MAGRGTPATALLARARVEYHVHSYERGDGAALGPEAAQAGRRGLKVPADLGRLTGARFAAIAS